MSYALSVEIFGAGLTPEEPSHWGLVINIPPSQIGDLLHVRTLDPMRGFFQFEPRFGTKLVTQQAYGLCALSRLSDQQRRQAAQIITAEKAPTDGKRNCQDWIFSALLSLEIEELVPAGTSGFWKVMIGKPAEYIKTAMGANWVDLRSL